MKRTFMARTLYSFVRPYIVRSDCLPIPLHATVVQAPGLAGEGRYLSALVEFAQHRQNVKYRSGQVWRCGMTDRHNKRRSQQRENTSSLQVVEVDVRRRRLRWRGDPHDA